MTSTRITAKDIAELAGVSRPTVSRALAGDPRIKRETTQRIKAIADRLGYQVNTIARSLKSGRSDVIGCIVPVLANPYFGNLVTQFDRALAARQLKLFLSISNGNSDLAREQVNVLNGYMVDGILWDISQHPEVAPFAMQLAQLVPLIPFGGDPISCCDHVTCDTMTGSLMLMRHLIELGHREIAFLGRHGHKGLLGRLEGYRRGLIEGGILPRDEWYIDCPNPQAINQALDRWQALSPRPSAIMCSHDELAINVMSHLKGRRLRIPQDVSIVGFDEIPMAGQCFPALTTIDQSAETFAIECVRLLSERIARKRQGDPDWNKNPQHVVLEPRMIVRQSSGPSNAKLAELVSN